MRRYWIGLLILVLVLVAGFWLWPRQPAPVTVRTRTVREGDFVREVNANGRVTAEIYQLSFGGAGRVAEVLVEQGQYVEAGQLLARLDATQAEAQLAALHSSRAAVLTAKEVSESVAAANRAKLGLQSEQAQLQLSRAQRLVDSGGMSRAELDGLELSARLLQADLGSLAANARAQEAELDAQLAGLEAQIAATSQILRESVLVAPVAGQIARVNLQVGERNGGPSLGGLGTATTDPLALASGLGVTIAGEGGDIVLVADGTLSVRLDLPEAYAPEVKVGQPARVELDASRGNFLTGRVSQIGILADGEGRSTVETELELADPGPARPGFTALAWIKVLEIPSATMVPLEALLEDGGSWVYVLDPDSSRVERRQVEIMARNLGEAAVRGVNPGDQVVILPSPELRDGQGVTYDPGL